MNSCTGPTLGHGQDVTQGLLLRGLKLMGIQRFSSRLIA